MGAYRRHVRPRLPRNVVILSDSAGNTGVGEVPGGEKIRQTLEDTRELLIDAPMEQRDTPKVHGVLIIRHGKLVLEPG